MGFKKDEISARRYFKALPLSTRNDKLHPSTGTKRHKQWNFRGFV